MMIAPEKCFQLYLAVKTHFTQAHYDAVKYNAKIKHSSKADLEERNDAKIIGAFAKNFNTAQDAASFFVANIGMGNLYPFENEDKAFALHKRWQKNRQSLTKMFRDDITMMEDTATYNTLFTGDDVPKAFIMMKNGTINMETLTIMDKLDGFVDDWRKQHPIWREDFLRIKKLGSFIKFDEDKFRAIAAQYMDKQ